MLYGCDISEFNPVQSWDDLNAAANFVIMRASFGTSRKDYQFDHNKAEAHRVQAGAGPLGIGYYHYAYPEYNAPQAEADFFVNNVSPLATGDVLALDWEEPFAGDHVQWCLQFLREVEVRTGIKPLLYLNQSLMNSHDWSAVISNGNGLWLADYDGNKTGTGVNTPWPVTALRQWTDGDAVAGVSGKVDGDTFYGDFAAFARYGHNPSPAPSPVPTPPAPTPPPVPAPVPPAPPPPVTPPAPLPPISSPKPSHPSLIKRILNWLRSWFK